MLTQGDLAEIRGISHREAVQLGYTVNTALPLLDAPASLRGIETVATRMLCIHAISALAHGFPKPAVVEWLESEGLVGSLAPSEARFLTHGGDQAAMQCRVDSLFALAWTTQIASAFDFQMDCPQTLARTFPNLRSAGSSGAFRQNASLRSPREIVSMADLAYCLHWSIRDELLHQRRPPGRLHPMYVIERRRAFEWMIGEDAWDDVSMST